MPLRNIQHLQILTVSSGLVLTASGPVRWPSEHLSTGLTPSLLQTCHQIHVEALPYLYKTNNIVFSHPSDCSMFTRITTPAAPRSLVRVTLYMQARSVERLWRAYLTSRGPIRSMSVDLPSLRRLTLALEGDAWLYNRHPEDNLHAWFNREPAFETVVRVAESILKHASRTHRPMMLRVWCRQRIPQDHFDLLHRYRTSPDDPEFDARSHMQAASDSCLRVGSATDAIPWTLDLVSPKEPPYCAC